MFVFDKPDADLGPTFRLIKQDEENICSFKIRNMPYFELFRDHQLSYSDSTL